MPRIQLLLGESVGKHSTVAANILRGVPIWVHMKWRTENRADQ